MGRTASGLAMLAEQQVEQEAGVMHITRHVVALQQRRMVEARRRQHEEEGQTSDLAHIAGDIQRLWREAHRAAAMVSQWEELELWGGAGDRTA